MGTHPIFESDFDCLTDMKLLPLITAAATTVLASKFDETESDYTIIVAPGKRDCYYENFKPETSFELEYQVTDGGDLDITLEIFDPSGKRVISDVRQEDGLHNLESNKGGDFQFCFDNRFSRMASKTVFWEVFLDDADYDDYDYADYKLDDEKEFEADTVTGLKKSLTSIKSNQGKTLQFQAMLRAFEAKDRSVMEHNYERVNFWSFVHLFAMVGTAVLQVYMLRSMFNSTTTTKSKVST